MKTIFYTLSTDEKKKRQKHNLLHETVNLSNITDFIEQNSMVLQSVLKLDLLLIKHVVKLVSGIAQIYF